MEPAHEADAPVLLKPPRKYDKEEIAKFDSAGKGKYDADGFYILSTGEYFDPEGYYFNKQGFDEFGGYYDKNGEYIAPPGVQLSPDGQFYYTA